MRRLLSVSTLGLASLVAVGLLTLQGGAASAKDDSVQQDPLKNMVKRDEDTPDIVMDDEQDDDDDDTGASQTRTRTGGLNTSGSTRTNGVDTSGHTREGARDHTGDDTNSRHTSVSRDRDRSRGDLTTDMTSDGPGRNNVDHSRNHTNDHSRHDTRR